MSLGRTTTTTLRAMSSANRLSISPDDSDPTGGRFIRGQEPPGCESARPRWTVRSPQGMSGGKLGGVLHKNLRAPSRHELLQSGRMMKPAQDRSRHDPCLCREPMAGNGNCREASGRVREARAETRVGAAAIVVDRPLVEHAWPAVLAERNQRIQGLRQTFPISRSQNAFEGGSLPLRMEGRTSFLRRTTFLPIPSTRSGILRLSGRRSAEIVCPSKPFSERPCGTTANGDRQGVSRNGVGGEIGWSNR
jgi:hypothetical protein